jgi:predicted RNA polymerase sigma factor
LDGIPADALAGSHLLPSVRGDLLERAGRTADAADAFRAAAALTLNEQEQRLLNDRADEALRSSRGAV